MIRSSLLRLLLGAPILAVAISASAWASSLANTTGYYRLPSLHNNTVVFTAESDLWVHKIGSPNARRLTTHVAEEHHSAISPDGSQVAFVANYEGASEVYTIAISGGVPKRITFENSNTRVQGWTKDGDILYSTTSRVGPTGNWTLRKVSPKTGVIVEIPLADAVEGDEDSEGKFIYFTQFGLQLSSDSAKIYRGGAEGEIWQYRLNSNKEAKLLTGKHTGDARQPMVSGNKIYFISDASGADNIWSMDLNGKNIAQLTQFTDWPVRAAQLNKQRIVFQQGADINLLDLNTNKVTRLNIKLVSDFPNLQENWVNKPLKYMTSASFAAKQKQVVITARGHVAIASIDDRRLIEIATPEHSRTRSAVLSHDGKFVYAINDASGELEIWRFAADGSINAKQLTTDGKIFRWNLHLSPDGKLIAHDDKAGNLWLLNIESGKNSQLLKGNDGMSPYANVQWSADSRFLAITQNRVTDERSRIQLIDLEEDKSKLLTSDKYNSYSPSFSPDGKWLYFLSERFFKASPSSPWGDRNMGTMFDRRSQIYAYALTDNANFAFAAANELNTTSDEAEIDKKEDKKSDSDNPLPEIVVDWENIQERLWQVPVISGNYYNLAVANDKLYVLDKVSEPGSKSALKVIKIQAKPEIKEYASNVSGFQLSADAKQLMITRKQGKEAKMYVVSAGNKFPADTKGKVVNTSAWQLALNPKEEWQQIFHDAWLMHRDFLYDRNMRGVNWRDVKAKYQPLLTRVTDRRELNDIFKQMMGELNTLHSQVRGGDIKTDTNAPALATLGAVLSQSGKGVQISHIYRYDHELVNEASPLLKPGVNAKEGDVIVAINGKTVTSLDDAHRLLRNKAGKQVLLELKRKLNTHKTVVVPVSSRQDSRMRYRDWVHSNAKKVNDENKNIGYMHIYAMGGGDVAEFAREFYANYSKHGLIIDVRRNRGGNIDSWIIEKLLRRVWMYWKTPMGEPSTNMQQTFQGHLVVLADQMTYSDGETFTAAIKANKLAPVIGKRTAGAGVWLRGANSQADNGMARVAEFPVYAPDGRWIVEGHGVSPTIEVDNLPHATYLGKDAQLEAAIEYLNKKMKAEPHPQFKAKPFPEVNTPAAEL